MRADASGAGSGFLSAMAEASAARAEAARRATSTAVLEARVRARGAAGDVPPALRLSPAGFDLIAEVKFASPSRGELTATPSAAAAAARAAQYAAGGAAAISVLTEPTCFGGALDHLRAAAGAVGVPVLRKDFLVDPHQIWEARDAGAGGVLLIVRMLDDEALAAMVEAARAAQLFVLLEAFDAADLARIAAYLALPRPSGGPPVLVGVNGRDLATLEVDPERCRDLAPALPSGVPAVAESGLATPADAARVARAGYRLALVGTSLMAAPEPAESVRGLLAAGRRAVEERA
ncbi:MAG: indole-3-glycerol-phosphate synthase [Planctomycetota bacterium]